MLPPEVHRQIRFEAPAGAVELLLVRHGESEAAVEGRPFPLVDGHGDPALSDDGVEQAERVGERLAGAGIDAIYVTSLRRTAQTAQPLAHRLGLTPIVEADLREVHLGEWEGGLFRKKVRDDDPIAIEMYTQQRWDVIPGAERGEVFSARVRAGIERIAAAHADQRVAVFAHGGTIGEVLAQATASAPFAFSGADNGSVSQLVVTPERWIVRRFNDTAHLEPGFSRQPEPLT